MEDIIKKIKSHPRFTFADSDDELIAIIDEINPGLSQDQKFEILDNLDKLGRSGFRKGGDEEDHAEDLEEELGDVEEELEDIEESQEEDREGRRRGLRRRGSRRGESVVMDEDGTTEEVDLPEPDEREGRRKGSRMGAYGGKSPEHQSSIKAAVAVAMSDRRL